MRVHSGAGRPWLYLAEKRGRARVLDHAVGARGTAVAAVRRGHTGRRRSRRLPRSNAVEEARDRRRALRRSRRSPLTQSVVGWTVRADLPPTRPTASDGVAGGCPIAMVPSSAQDRDRGTPSRVSPAAGERGSHLPGVTPARALCSGPCSRRGRREPTRQRAGRRRARDLAQAASRVPRPRASRGPRSSRPARGRR